MRFNLLVSKVTLFLFINLVTHQLHARGYSPLAQYFTQEFRQRFDLFGGPITWTDNFRLMKRHAEESILTPEQIRHFYEYRKVHLQEDFYVFATSFLEQLNNNENYSENDSMLSYIELYDLVSILKTIHLFSFDHEDFQDLTEEFYLRHQNAMCQYIENAEKIQWGRLQDLLIHSSQKTYINQVINYLRTENDLNYLLSMSKTHLSGEKNIDRKIDGVNKSLNLTNLRVRLFIHLLIEKYGLKDIKYVFKMATSEDETQMILNTLIGLSFDAYGRFGLVGGRIKTYLKFITNLNEMSTWNQTRELYEQTISKIKNMAVAFVPWRTAKAILLGENVEFGLFKMKLADFVCRDDNFANDLIGQ